MKSLRFYFHYNKPESKKIGKPQLSLHFKNTCFIVDKIVCNVMTETKNSIRQPFCRVQGYCTEIKIRDKIALIN